MDGVYAPHNNAIVIVTYISTKIIQSLLVDGTNNLCVVFPNYLQKTKLYHDLIMEWATNVLCFDGHKCHRLGK